MTSGLVMHFDLGWFLGFMAEQAERQFPNRTAGTKHLGKYSSDSADKLYPEYQCRPQEFPSTVGFVM